MSEDDLRSVFTWLAGELSDTGGAIFNLHPPPYDSGLYEAPVLDENLQVRCAANDVLSS